jgi:AraC-like DNA-binding protein
MIYLGQTINSTVFCCLGHVLALFIYGGSSLKTFGRQSCSFYYINSPFIEFSIKLVFLPIFFRDESEVLCYVMEIFTLPTSPASLGADPIQLFEYGGKRLGRPFRVQLSAVTFSFVQKGSKEFVAMHGQQYVRCKELLIAKPGKCLFSEFESPDEGKFCSTILFVSLDTLMDYFRQKGLLRLMQPSDKTFEVFHNPGFVNPFVESLQYIKQLSPDVRSQVLQAKFQELMSFLLGKMGEGYLDFLLSDGSARSKHLLDVVEKNRLKKMTVRDLAFLANMSVSSFQREFEQHYEESPARWFLNQRLEHAAYLLKMKSCRASDVYWEVGYTSLSTFIQAFKARFGVTPKQYQSK